MTLQEINRAYNRAVGSLDAKELKNAFDSLQTLIAGSREYTFQDRLDELQDTYKYMLHYRIEGMKDAMEEQIYRNVHARSYELADAVRQKVLGNESPLSFYSQRRNLGIQPQPSYKQTGGLLEKACVGQDQKEYDSQENRLFNRIWVSGFLTEEEMADIRDILMDNSLPFTTGCQIVSALMLGLLEAFDEKKMLLLFDAAARRDEAVSIRALVAILVILYLYRRRTALYPQITHRLEALAETPGFTRSVRSITLRFILARETEKITRKLQDEIIPEMMKMSPKLSSKINLKEISPEQLGEEMNPEWENFFSDGSLGKKIEEFGELQQEGADVMHSTFIHLKNFPFFREVGNWLLPFTFEHSSLAPLFVEGDETEKQTLDSMTAATFICDSDKYSLYFSIMQLPREARKMMLNQIDSQVTEMVQQKIEELVSKRGAVDTIAGQYIQDLYRFFKLYPGHLDFTDIFALPLDFHNLDILQPYISDTESLTTIAEYYLHKNYFSDALTVFTRLAASDPNNEILFQKIGYCRQMEGDLDGALEAYRHADLLNTDSKWVIRKIAGCYRSLKQPEKALAYYRRYEALNPDNLSVQISIGHCYLELKDYSEALKCFFKVDYLDNQSHKAWRPIAWCSFLTGKYDQARNYYRKITDRQPNAQDLLNAGHTEWALQNIKGALDYYRQAVQMENGDFSKFQEQFNQDIPDLLIAGIEETDIALMLDQLRYRLEGLV